jgi:hypothetical protein
MADVWDFGPEDPVDSAVMLWLANRCNDQGESCWPSVAEISRKARCCERTVVRAIARLEDNGWITVERGVGQGHTSQYKLNVERLKRCHIDTFSGAGKGDSVTPFKGAKGDFDDTGKVTPTTRKGDFDDIPPHPLNGRTIIETPGEPSGALARTVPPELGNLCPGLPAMNPVAGPDAGAEMMAAVWIFDELAVPSDFGMRSLAAQAIRLQAKDWGGVQAAAERILKAAKEAQANGETRWRFWFEDCGYLRDAGQQGTNRGGLRILRVR